MIAYSHVHSVKYVSMYPPVYTSVFPGCYMLLAMDGQTSRECLVEM